MDDNKRECPHCKGIGSLPKKRERVLSSDPRKKWCNLCKQFLDRKKDFYGVTGYCKKCQIKRVRANQYDPLKRLKYENRCCACGSVFLGYRLNQSYCSRKCVCDAMNNKKIIKRYKCDSLSNELRDQLLNNKEYS